jgi:hypothetical protein
MDNVDVSCTRTALIRPHDRTGPKLDLVRRQSLLIEYRVPRTTPGPSHGAAAHTAAHKVTMAAKALCNSRAQLPPERTLALRRIVADACDVTEDVLTAEQIAEAAVPRALVRCGGYVPEAEAIMAQVRSPATRIAPGLILLCCLCRWAVQTAPSFLGLASQDQGKE